MKKLGDKAIKELEYTCKMYPADRQHYDYCIDDIKELQERAYIVRNCSVNRIKKHIQQLQDWMCCACPTEYSDLCKKCKTKAETKAILKALKSKQAVSQIKK
jgi:hypothetical protein